MIEVKRARPALSDRYFEIAQDPSGHSCRLPAPTLKTPTLKADRGEDRVSRTSQVLIVRVL